MKMDNYKNRQKKGRTREDPALQTPTISFVSDTIFTHTDDRATAKAAATTAGP